MTKDEYLHNIDSLIAERNKRIQSELGGTTDTKGEDYEKIISMRPQKEFSYKYHETDMLIPWEGVNPDKHKIHIDPPTNYKDLSDMLSGIEPTPEQRAYSAAFKAVMEDPRYSHAFTGVVGAIMRGGSSSQPTDSLFTSSPKGFSGIETKLGLTSAEGSNDIDALHTLVQGMCEAYHRAMTDIESDETRYKYSSFSNPFVKK